MFFKLGGNWYFVFGELVTTHALSASQKLQERLDKEGQGEKQKTVTRTPKIELTDDEELAIAAILSDSSTVLLTQK